MKKGFNQFFFSILVLSSSIHACSKVKNVPKNDNLPNQINNPSFDLNNRDFDQWMNQLHPIKSKSSVTRILQGEADDKIHYFDVGNGRSHLYAGDQGALFPQSPNVHNYDPFPSDILLNIKLPSSLYKNLPNSLHSFCQREKISNVEIYLHTIPTSTLEIENSHKSALKPHYWLDKDAPMKFDGVRYQKNVWMGIFQTVYPLQQIDVPVSSTKKFPVIIHDSVASPDTGYVNIPELSYSFWSLVYEDQTIEVSERTAAITLHWFLSDKEQNELSQILANHSEISMQKLFLNELKKSHQFENNKTYSYVSKFIGF